MRARCVHVTLHQVSVQAATQADRALDVGGRAGGEAAEGRLGQRLLDGDGIEGLGVAGDDGQADAGHSHALVHSEVGGERAREAQAAAARERRHGRDRATSSTIPVNISVAVRRRQERGGARARKERASRADGFPARVAPRECVGHRRDAQVAHGRRARADELGRDEPAHVVREAASQQSRRQPRPGLDESGLHEAAGPSGSGVPTASLPAPRASRRAARSRWPPRFRHGPDLHRRPRGGGVAVGRGRRGGDDGQRLVGVGVREEAGGLGASAPARSRTSAERAAGRGRERRVANREGGVVGPRRAGPDDDGIGRGAPRMDPRPRLGPGHPAAVARGPSRPARPASRPP